MGMQVDSLNSFTLHIHADHSASIIFEDPKNKDYAKDLLNKGIIDQILPGSLGKDKSLYAISAAIGDIDKDSQAINDFLKGKWKKASELDDTDSILVKKNGGWIKDQIQDLPFTMWNGQWVIPFHNDIFALYGHRVELISKVTQFIESEKQMTSSITGFLFNDSLPKDVFPIYCIDDGLIRFALTRDQDIEKVVASENMTKYQIPTMPLSDLELESAFFRALNKSTSNNSNDKIHYCFDSLTLQDLQSSTKLMGGDIAEIHNYLVHPTMLESLLSIAQLEVPEGLEENQAGIRYVCGLYCGKVWISDYVPKSTIYLLPGPEELGIIPQTSDGRRGLLLAEAASRIEVIKTSEIPVLEFKRFAIRADAQQFNYPLRLKIELEQTVHAFEVAARSLPAGVALAGIKMRPDVFSEIFVKSIDIKWDPVTEREVLNTGLFGHYQGLEIWVDRALPKSDLDNKPTRIYPIFK
jgi:hypothetical protein